jgi:hypothetical protein
VTSRDWDRDQEQFASEREQTKTLARLSMPRGGCVLIVYSSFASCKHVSFDDENKVQFSRNIAIFFLAHTLYERIVD